MGLLDQFGSLADNPTMALAMGLLNASGPQSRPVSLGQALGQGLGEMQQARQNQVRQALADMQMQQMRATLDEQRRRQAAMDRLRGKLSAPMQDVFDISQNKVIDSMLKEPEKPQLVEVADPSDPLRMVKKWVVPGQNDGVVVGQTALPHELDPRITANRMRVAAAGKPSIENKIYNTAETEQAKAYGKSLGEVRSNIAQAAFAAPAKLQQLSRMEQLLEGVGGGKLAPFGKEVASAANSIGIKIDPKLGNKEAAESLAREIAGSFRKPGEGVMTDKDFENFMRRVPDLSKSAEGRQEIIATMRAAIRRDIGAHKVLSAYAARRNGNIDDAAMDELANYYAQNPIFDAPKSAPNGGPPPGAVRLKGQ